MKFCMNRAMYYLTFFDKMRKDGFIDAEFYTLFDGITTVFCLPEKEKQEVLSFWNNEYFTEINSSQLAQFHLEFIKSMKFDSGIFGCNEKEKNALNCKLDGLEFYEKISKSDSDLISAFEHNIDRRQVSVCFSMLQYLSCGIVPDRLLSQLRKNVTAKSFCDYDSLIFLLNIDRDNREQYKNILQKSSFSLYSDDYERIMQKYFLARREIQNDSRKTS